MWLRLPVNYGVPTLMNGPEIVKFVHLKESVSRQKNRKDQEESIKFNDNGYYRGLDRNIWKVSDYAGTNIVKEEPITRGISPNWEDYVPDYSQHHEVVPIGYKSHKKNTTTDLSKYTRKKHSRRALTPREWSSRRSIAPMSYDEYEDYIPQKSSGNRSKSRRKKYEQNSSKRSISCTSLRRNRKHSGHRSSRHSRRHRKRLAKSASSEIEVDLGADDGTESSLTDIDMEPYRPFQQEGSNEGGNIPVAPLPVTEPNLQYQAFYKNTGNAAPTFKEILIEFIYWSVLGIAVMLVLTYRSSLPPLNCSTGQPELQSQQTAAPL